MSKKNKPDLNKKTAGNNQWTSTHLKEEPDTRTPRSGPGGD
ncbi:MAG: hypothetical protein Q4F95_03300 [Oscillospiraceae bacterium]|nr:hypothetical protein [Oscillospiraceae bacterium]